MLRLSTNFLLGLLLLLVDELLADAVLAALFLKRPRLLCLDLPLLPLKRLDVHMGECHRSVPNGGLGLQGVRDSWDMPALQPLFELLNFVHTSTLPLEVAFGIKWIKERWRRFHQLWRSSARNVEKFAWRT
jgi:hypothetical protein